MIRAPEKETYIAVFLYFFIFISSSKHVLGTYEKRAHDTYNGMAVNKSGIHCISYM